MNIRVVSTPIVGSALTQLAISRTANDWFEPVPASAAEWKERASLARSSLLQPAWLDVLNPAFGGPSPARDRLEHAARSGVVVTSGQQPGLFGGPLYTWWKALSVLALADALHERTGLPVAPVFWAATDDSDFAESASTVVATTDGAEVIEMPEPDGIGVALADVPLGDLSEQIRRLEAATGSASAGAFLDMVRRAYTPGNTIGRAYVDLVRSIVEPLGVSVIDAAHPAVRKAAHPLLLRSLELGQEIGAALAQRSDELKRAGHPAQVKIVDGRTLAFAEARGKRERIRIRDAADVARAAEPGSLGPNVLLRPIVEKSILPTVAYMGGPAEIAYFAQVGAVAEVLGVSAPIVVPRWSGYVVEPRIERILERYGLRAEDFADPHSVETRLARASLSPGVAHSIETMKAAIDEATEGLQQADGDGLVPPGVAQGLRRNVAHRIERLERRLTASVKRRGNEALRDVATARGALNPFGKPQERAINIIPLLTRYGDVFVEEVMKEVRRHVSGMT